jgi:alpha-pyrone synthase
MRGLATGVPKYKVSQRHALTVALKAPECSGLANVLERVYSNTRIEHRYMAIPGEASITRRRSHSLLPLSDFTPEQNDDQEDLFFPDEGFDVTIQERMEKFREAAVPLVTSVALDAIKKANVKLSDIRKLVVVSSTGFLGPSLDCELIKSLGLSRNIDRSLIGFMGCAAAMNGYRIGMDFVTAHPESYALLVCVELSSVNCNFKDSVNNAIIHAIFGDGCAATVLSSVAFDDLAPGQLVIYDEYSHLLEGTEDGIELSINDDGISCKLSKYLPQYISKNVGGYVSSFLNRHQLSTDAVDFWAIHPGGKRIIEETQNGLGLTETAEGVKDSWEVLKEYGNMLSPSVMFVLERILKRHEERLKRGERGYELGLAFSFSPGVGVEGIMLKRVK